MATANACFACGKSGKLLRCGRCHNAWFCNRECQIVARKELGHRGANCRPTDGVQSPPSQPSTTTMGVPALLQSYAKLHVEGRKAHMTHTRIGLKTAVEKFREAATVTDLFGSLDGAALLRAQAYKFLSSCLAQLGDKAAAFAACTSLQAARASGSKTALVAALSVCGEAAMFAPGEMVSAETESREQERLSGPSPSFGSLNLSQEGRISLPTTPAALSRLGLAYNEAAVALCDTATAAAGGRGSPAANDTESVPDVSTEAQARGPLGFCLHMRGEERQRSLELLRQAVGLRRQELRTAAPGRDAISALSAQRVLADELCTLGMVGVNHLSKDVVEAEACLREALALGENLDDVQQQVKTLRCLINLFGEAGAAAGPTEAEALRSRLNQLLVQMGREPETSCSIRLEPLAPPADGAAEAAAGSDGSGPSDSCVRVLHCNHQFHKSCLSTWWRTTGNGACPLCKK